MQRWVVFLLTGLIGLGALLGWREWAHRSAQADWLQQVSALEEQAAQLNQAVESARETNISLGDTVSEMEVTVQSLRDRLGNLEAQRDHLQAEIKRQSERVRTAESGIESARAEVETARQALLEQSARPRQLESRLQQALLRIEEMESALDAAAVSLAEAPPLLTVEGLSSNQSVFSLNGPLPSAEDLPLPVTLCRRDNVVLEGWIHRRENGRAIGHVAEWREPASTLVKGEKVFILRNNHHEAEP
jgi:predicted negative regulator of RcsB-dependent stress response